MRVLTIIYSIFFCFTTNSQVKLNNRIQFSIESNTQLEIDSVQQINGRKVTFVKDPDAIDFPDFQPSCKGGDKELERLIIENFEVSTKTLLKTINKNGAQKLQVKFDIDSSGKLLNIKVTSGIDTYIDAEIIRILNLTEWYPGEHKGKRVNSSCTLNITFSET